MIGILLAFILLAAAGLRIHRLDEKSLWYDEFASIELAMGRGYARYELPTDQVIPEPPNLTDLKTAAPLKSVWFSEMCGHVPPLYELLLRLWGDAFGLSPKSARGFSLAASLAAIIALFFAVRTISGDAAALWSAALMALAGPQIQWAQEARGYTLLLAFSLIAAAMILRIERHGVSLARAASLTISLLAMILTHYFAVGAMLALGIYTVVRLRRPTLWQTLGCFALAAALWCGLGAPVALRQSAHLSDPAATNFLRDNGAGHVMRTVSRMAALPVRYITEPMTHSLALAAIGGVAFALAILAPLRQRDLFLWGLWLWLTILPIAALDLLRETKHLEFVRYTLLASPALYVLIAGSLSTSKSSLLRHLPPAAVAIACLLALPAAYEAWWKADWRDLHSQFAKAHRSGDIVVFTRSDENELFMRFAYVHLRYYANGSIGPTVFLTHPPDDALRRQLRSAPLLVVANSAKEIESMISPIDPAISVSRVAFSPGAAGIWRVTSAESP